MSGQEKNTISLCPFHALFNRYILQVVRLSGKKHNKTQQPQLSFTLLDWFFIFVFMSHQVSSSNPNN